MSDATKRALDAAVAAHFADQQGEAGGICTGYVLQMGGVGHDQDETLFGRSFMEGQGIITTLGLIRWLQSWSDNEGSVPDA